MLDGLVDVMLQTWFVPLREGACSNGGCADDRVQSASSFLPGRILQVREENLAIVNHLRCGCPCCLRYLPEGGCVSLLGAQSHLSSLWRTK